MNIVFVERSKEDVFLEECKFIRKSFQRYGHAVIQKEFEPNNSEATWIINGDSLRRLKKAITDTRRDDAFESIVKDVFKENITGYVRDIKTMRSLLGRDDFLEIIVADGTDISEEISKKPGQFVIAEDFWLELKGYLIEYYNGDDDELTQDIFAIKDMDGDIQLFEYRKGKIYWKSTLLSNSII